MPIKRLHYFDKQFLVEKDFTDEQKYHLEMRRRLNRLLHTAGIAEGLKVEKTGNKEVTVRPGAAIDSEGREIILEADQVVDLSDPAKFQPGDEVSITIVYEEEETDESTSTVPGKTRITEKGVVQAAAGPPPDKTVVLAHFKLDGAGNVPGATNSFIAAPSDQNVLPRGGLLSLDGVSNPGGNIDLVQSGAIIITPDNLNKRIAISENHSALKNNPHQVTAAQIGALLAKDYDLSRRATAQILFTQGDANGATRTINVGFLPRLVLVVGTSTVSMALRTYGGGVGAFAVIGEDSTVLFQRCFGFGITRISNADWFVRGFTGSGICISTHFNQEVAPIQAENLTVSITGVSPTGLTAALSRGVVNVGNAALSGFSITLQLLCLG
ncbi:MAG: hypothetical protein AB1631_25535 [Acidobacteriota bacterium]